MAENLGIIFIVVEEDPHQKRSHYKSLLLETKTNYTLKDKIAIVTGGSSGIGAAIVDSLLEQGALVVNADILIPPPHSCNHKDCFHFRTDITNVSDVQRLYAFVRKQVGQPHIIVLNAGKGIHEKLSEGDPEKWFSVINLNVMGSLRILRSFLPDLLAGDNAHILIVSSVSSHHAYEYGGIYASTKAALDMIAETLRLEIKDKGRVTVVSPGVVATNFFTNMESGQLNVDEIGAGALSAAEVADAAVFALTRPRDQVINNITLRPRNQSF